MTFWEKILHHFKDLYYTDALWFCCALVSLIIGIRHYRKERVFILLLIYLIANLTIVNLVPLFFVFGQNLNGVIEAIFIETSNTCFALIELSVFLYFFYKVLKLFFLKKVVLVLWVVFIIICSYFFILISSANVQRNEILSTSYFINCIEFLMILPLCLFYFHQQINSEIELKFLTSLKPSFWIVTGLFFYCFISLPYLLVGEKLVEISKPLNLLFFKFHYLSISVLILCIAKSFSCKSPLTI